MRHVLVGRELADRSDGPMSVTLILHRRLRLGTAAPVPDQTFGFAQILVALPAILLGNGNGHPGVAIR